MSLNIDGQSTIAMSMDWLFDRRDPVLMVEAWTQKRLLYDDFFSHATVRGAGATASIL
ncbi:MAG: hypothetical protein HN589_10265 [Proteobacteria bacterium]|nr:hypothetical protein [Pseudomonadota bacterium]